ncbi:MAG: hypothetical protein LBT35_00630 [Tannerella sp.]|jgi:hypothetical protein|nr:hypothetical protein [Tannerella sp.]
MKKKYLLMMIMPALLFSCADGGWSSEGSMASDGGGGQGGSMARFAVSGDNLYTVDSYTLKVFDISDERKPIYLPSKDQRMNFGVETVFPLDTLLFIGSQDGLYIYNIVRPEFPQEIAHIMHVTSCDPVVSDGRYAYVTLNTEHVRCGRDINQLQVYDLEDITRPKLVNAVSNMYHPRGLGIHGSRLFVCDKGLKIYDLSAPDNPVWIDDLDKVQGASGIDAYDVIPVSEKVLLLIGADGFYQFDISGEKITLLSKITVSSPAL